MQLLTRLLILLIVLLHCGFLVLEMFLWTRPLGRKTFRLTPEFATASRALAANQGLYNGFLAAGLLWGLSQGATGTRVTLFFLCCVVVAGVFGAVTVSRQIFWVQAAPALVAIMLIMM